MIALLAATGITLTALQAAINAPREAFRACLKDASAKASNEKVGAEAYAAYVRNNCSAQLGTFKGAVVKFDMGNKMSKKASDDDADQMIADFVDSALDHYKYITGSDSGAKQNASAATAPTSPTPTPTPAAVPQPPK
jgi:hypothetical protein